MNFLYLLFLFLLPILPAGLNPATPVASKPMPAAKPKPSNFAKPSPTLVKPSKPTSTIVTPSKPTSTLVIPSKPTSTLVIPSKPLPTAQPKPASKPIKPTRPANKPIAPIPNPAGPKKPAGPISKPVIRVEVPKPKSSPIPPTAPIVLNGVKIMVKSKGVGWVGFGVSQSGSMIGSVAAIGLPGDVSKYYLGGKYVGSGGVAKVSDQNLKDTDFIQTPTLTTLKFTAPLDWNCGTLPFQNPDQTNFVLARGSSNTLAYHAYRETLSYSLAYCLDPAHASDQVCISDDLNYDQMRTSGDGNMVIYTKLINIV